MITDNRSNDGESDELKEQVTMYQEMLNAKDDTIMQLTNEITALEKEVNNNQTGTMNQEPDSPRQRQTVIVMTDTQELARLKVWPWKSISLIIWILVSIVYSVEVLS